MMYLTEKGLNCETVLMTEVDMSQGQRQVGGTGTLTDRVAHTLNKRKYIKKLNTSIQASVNFYSGEY